jgi:hypothetical protein
MMEEAHDHRDATADIPVHSGAAALPMIDKQMQRRGAGAQLLFSGDSVSVRVVVQG